MDRREFLRVALASSASLVFMPVSTSIGSRVLENLKTQDLANWLLDTGKRDLDRTLYGEVKDLFASATDR